MFISLVCFKNRERKDKCEKAIKCDTDNDVGSQVETEDAESLKKFTSNFTRNPLYSDSPSDLSENGAVDDDEISDRQLNDVEVYF